MHTSTSPDQPVLASAVYPQRMQGVSPRQLRRHEPSRLHPAWHRCPYQYPREQLRMPHHHHRWPAWPPSRHRRFQRQAQQLPPMRHHRCRRRRRLRLPPSWPQHQYQGPRAELACVVLDRVRSGSTNGSALRLDGDSPSSKHAASWRCGGRQSAAGAGAKAKHNDDDDTNQKRQHRGLTWQPLRFPQKRGCQTFPPKDTPTREQGQSRHHSTAACVGGSDRQKPTRTTVTNPGCEEHLLTLLELLVLVRHDSCAQLLTLPRKTISGSKQLNEVLTTT